MNEQLTVCGPACDPSVGYEAALCELGRLFRDRGLARSARLEAERFEHRVEEERDPASVGSRMSDLLVSDEGCGYRSERGRDGGVMTNDDAIRLFFDVSGRRPIEAEAVTENAPEMRAAYESYAQTHPIRPAAVYAVVDRMPEEQSGNDLIPTDGEAAAVIDRRAEDRRCLGNALLRLTPQDKIGKARRVRNYSGATAPIALIVFVALVLMLPVVLTVMINRASRDVSSYEKSLRDLSDTEEKLEAELAVRQDLLTIERIATEEYGMIRFELGKPTFLRLNDGDIVRSFDTDTEGENTAFLALLSALGIRFGEE